jgi:hypothetical protein
LKNQIEVRLTFLNSGQKPRKNLDVIKKIHDMLQNMVDDLLKKKRIKLRLKNLMIKRKINQRRKKNK